MDIDIDTRPDFDPIEIFPEWTRASIISKDGRNTPHNCGVYVQNVPRDPITGIAAIPYKEAENIGFFKIDFLHLHIYSYFESHEEIKQLLKIEPNWTLLKSPSTVKQLFQLGDHFQILSQLCPTSIDDVADALALIRPSKMHLIGMYMSDKKNARALLYIKEDSDAYAFKKAHAYAYAQVIVLQLHLISMGVNFI